MALKASTDLWNTLKDRVNSILGRSKEDWVESAEELWDTLKNRVYYILFLLLLILCPFIMGAMYQFGGNALTFPPIPILSDIYSVARTLGLFGANTYVLRILSLCGIMAIFAASWDFLSGYTGQVSFGHALFWGISAYFMFWFATGFNFYIGEIYIGTAPLFPPLITLILGGVISALLAIIIGFIALRVKGYYLALITLVFPLVAAQLANVFDGITGGDYGTTYLGVFPRIIEKVVQFTSPVNKEIDQLQFFLFVVLIMLIAVGVMMLIAYSRIGLAFQAIREDEEAAESLGIHLSRYKIAAFSISAFFAGIAGGLYGQWFGWTGPTFFDAAHSFNVLIMTILGGIGTIVGGVIGAFLVVLLLNLFLDPVLGTGLEILVFGLILVISLRYMPFGLARANKDQKQALVIGIIFAIAGSLVISAIINALAINLVLIILFIVSLPALPIFIISDIVGLFFLQGILNLELSAADLVKARFLIYIVAGIPYAYYLPKLYKKARLRLWGIWPSAGRYEPD
ncbi:MAG: branched-chain amino acid ABC transporter permease [Candidatus Hermodarchaeota archaeon]